MFDRGPRLKGVGYPGQPFLHLEQVIELHLEQVIESTKAGAVPPNIDNL